MHLKDIFTLMWLLPVALVVILYFGVTMYARYEKAQSRKYGGGKYYKNKFVDKSCMPINLNLILALIFAYIVYTMFYNY
jgi:hypothetical protein